MNEIKESLLKVFKSARLQCARGNCADCKYGELHCCDDHLIIDLILDNFVVAEKLQENKLRFEDVEELKQKLNSIYGKSSIENMPKPISDVIFVEDGSADTDKLQEQFGDNVPIIIYRQGGAKPEIQHLACPITPEFLKKETESK